MIHGQLAMAVCIVGSLFNVANILVLTHKDMKLNPINMILTGIAVADCLVMVEYIPFSIHMYLLEEWGREQEDEVASYRSCLKYPMVSFSVFPCLGILPLVPHQLQHHDPHRVHLAHPLPRHLEVHHDQVLHSFCVPLHPT